MNFNIELLQMKCSDFRFNLLIVKKYNTCYVSFSSVGFPFQIYSGLMKWDVIKKTMENGNFHIVVSLLYAHYPIFFFLSYK